MTIQQMLLATSRVIVAGQYITNKTGQTAPFTVTTSGSGTTITSTTIPSFSSGRLFIGWNGVHRFINLTPAIFVPGNPFNLDLHNGLSGIFISQCVYNGATWLAVNSAGTVTDNTSQTVDSASLPFPVDASNAWAMLELYK